MAAAATELGLAFLQAFWDGDFERGYALCAPDATWTFQNSLHVPREVPVRQAVQFLMDRLVAGFAPESGYTVAVRDAIGTGDEAAIEYSATGQTRRGGVYTNHYVVRFTTRQGRIVSIRPYFDTLYVHRTLAELD